MQKVLVACIINNKEVEGYADLETYFVERKSKKRAFSRNGKLPKQNCYRLLLDSNYFKMEIGKNYLFKILGDEYPRLLPVTDFYDATPLNNISYEWFPAIIFWVIELR